MSNNDNVYTAPNSQLENTPDDETVKNTKSANRKKKKDRLILYIILVNILNLIYVFIEANSKGLSGANIIAYAIGSIFVLPIGLVVISQIIPVFRNNYIRLNVFFWSSLIIFLLKTFIVVAIVIG